MSSPSKQQQRTVKPVTQFAAQIRASFAAVLGVKCKVEPLPKSSKTN